MSFKPTIFQLAQSYVMPVVLATASSAFNPQLEVVLRRGRLQLLTQNAIYSYADLYDNFSKIFEKINLPADGSRVLVLGWGLGSIPFMLETTFAKKYEYVGVEVDKKIIELFQNYVSLASDVKLVADDAAIWVESQANIDAPKVLFDLICIDVFVDAIVPTDFHQLDFLKNIKYLLKPDGIVVFNRLSQNQTERQDSEKYFKTIFQPTFPHSNAIDVIGNLMLVGQNL